MALPELDYSLVIDGRVVPLANTNTYIVGPLATLVNYQSYVVKASGIDGYGRTTDCVASAPVVVGGNVAFPPAGFASSVGASGVTFSWKPPDPNRYLVATYNVKAGSASSGPFTTVLAKGVAGASTTVPVPSEALAGLTSYVVVASVNPAGEGAPTAPLTISLPPLAPTSLRATPGSDSIALTWAASQGAASYGVLYSRTNGGPYTSAGTTASPSLYVTGLARGTTYYFVVVATGPTGSSPKSAQLTAATARVLM